ncbi:hypothetical protein ZWY2020_009451 [Hordeum vulgare]|nr:hypothetical protein ZWY2020_009451 [Hordeum vulgare]
MAAAPPGPRGIEKPPTDAPTLVAAKAKSPERQDDGLQKADAGRGEKPPTDAPALEAAKAKSPERREDGLQAADAERGDESTKVNNPADDGGRVGSPKSENIKNRPWEDAATTSTAKGDGKPMSWSSNLLKAGKAVEESSRYVGSWHAPLQHSSDFLRQVSRYAPVTGLQHGCPAAFIWLYWACDKVSSFLADAATAVQGASALGRMVGQCTSMIGKKLTAQLGEETEKDGTAKVIIRSCEQLEEVLKFWEAGARVQLDIGPDVSPALANLLYEILRQRGPAALELIKSGQNMRAKRSGA